MTVVALYTLVDLAVAFGLGCAVGGLAVLVWLWPWHLDTDEDDEPTGDDRQRPEMPGYLDHALAQIERWQINNDTPDS
ncbi:MAG: hypothetical protein AAFQ43_00465 [Bacteroidota bacterium]